MSVTKIVLLSVGLPLLGIGLLLIPLLLFRRFHAAKLKIPEGSLEKLGIERSLLAEIDRNFVFFWYFVYLVVSSLHYLLPRESIFRWGIFAVIFGLILIYTSRRFLLYARAWAKTSREDTNLRKVLFYYSIGCVLAGIFGLFIFLTLAF